jgi:hypothetical protein
LLALVLHELRAISALRHELVVRPAQESHVGRGDRCRSSFDRGTCLGIDVLQLEIAARLASMALVAVERALALVA